jgi:DNA (cytosine-5)-methyltransferase 1
MAGFEVLACAEIRSEARTTYINNHPGAIAYDDIRKVSAEKLLSDLRLKPGELDLMAACPPCQGFSSMRTKNGAIAYDPRNELIFEVLRLAKKVQPKCILIENVPALLKDQRLMQFKADLAALGYKFSEGVLDAQNFGVPQRRKRMILIGSRFGEFGLPEESKARRLVKDVLWGLPEPESKHKRPLHRMRQHFTPIVERRIQTIKKNRTELPSDLVLECHKKYPKGFKDVYGRMEWNDVSPTITRSSHNPSKGRFLHPQQNRGITLYESLLLQGFPRSYSFDIKLGIGKISSMIGEAFPPPMAAAQARHIMRKLDLYDPLD